MALSPEEMDARFPERVDLRGRESVQRLLYELSQFLANYNCEDGHLAPDGRLRSVEAVTIQLETIEAAHQHALQECDLGRLCRPYGETLQSGFFFAQSWTELALRRAESLIEFLPHWRSQATDSDPKWIFEWLQESAYYAGRDFRLSELSERIKTEWRLSGADDARPGRTDATSPAETLQHERRSGSEPPFPLKRNYPLRRGRDGEFRPVYPSTVVELRLWVAEEWRRAGLAGQISDKATAERIAVQAAAEIVADAVQWLELLAAYSWVSGPEPKTQVDASREISRLLRDIDNLIAGMPYDRAAAESDTRCRLDGLFFAVDDIRQWSNRTFRGWEPGRKKRPEEYGERSALENRFNTVCDSVAHVPLLLRQSAENWQELLRELKSICWRLLNANSLWAKGTGCTGPAETMREKADATEAADAWFEKRQNDLDRVMRELRRQAGLLEIPMADGKPPEPEDTAGSSPPAGDADGQWSIVVDADRARIVFQSETFDVGSPQALRWLKVLTDRPGEWISSTDLERHDSELYGARTSRLKNAIPEAVACHIESTSGKGSRWNPPA